MRRTYQNQILDDHRGLKAIASAGTASKLNDYNRASGLIDLAFAPNRFTLAIGALYHVVAIAEPAAGLTLLHPTAQTTMGLGGEVLQERVSIVPLRPT